MKYQTIIGLEIHVQLKTHTKMFCSCKNKMATANPNTNICPICMGHPGTLPTLNKKAVEYGIMAARALHCEVPAFSKFDRKSYFYPDLPKGYQISQYDKPIGQEGYVVIPSQEQRVRVSIERIHLEEDAAKNIHDKDSGKTLVDYNRGGTPLAEIVTKPDIKSPEDARTFLQELKKIMQYIGVSDADMEKGQLRCDANISLRPEGDLKYYPKTEVKNLNSFRAVEKALKYEIERQQKLWDQEDYPKVQATRGWDEKLQQTVEQRVKEEAHDYRYFPEPDIPPLQFTKKEVEEIEKKLPELPGNKRKRFRKQYDLNLQDADVLTGTKALADFYERAITEAKEWLNTKGLKGEEHEKKIIKLTSNWLMTELLKELKSKDQTINELQVTPENFAELMGMLAAKELNSSAGQTVLYEMFAKGGDPSQIAEEKNLLQENNEEKMAEIVDQVLGENEKAIKEYKEGKEKALQFLIGQIMRLSKGQANPELARELIQKKLK